MYFPVSAAGYILLGQNVPSNILLFQDEMSVIVKVAIIFEVVNLIVTYLISFNPICQTFEEIFNLPRSRLLLLDKKTLVIKLNL